MKNCIICDKPIEQTYGKRLKKYCGGNCRTKAFLKSKRTEYGSKPVGRPKKVKP